MTSYKVLYVDDEPDIRDVAVMSLEIDADFDVRSCSGGKDALVEAERWRPDLILLDVMMPDMDGPTTLAELHKMDSTRAIPVVFITARTQSYEIERFISLGAKGVISKPFDPMTLAAEAKRYL